MKCIRPQIIFITLTTSLKLLDDWRSRGFECEDLGFIPGIGHLSFCINSKLDRFRLKPLKTGFTKRFSVRRQFYKATALVNLTKLHITTSSAVWSLTTW